MSALDQTLDKKTLASLWKAVDQNNAGVIELTYLYELLSSRFGKDKSSKSSSLLETVKAKILERSGSIGGIKGLSR